MHNESPCPVQRIMRVLMGNWTTYILYILHRNGSQRFGVLNRAIPGISAKVLTERLRMLEEEGLVQRDYKPTIPPEVSYTLTERGLELQGVLNGLNDLGMKWYGQEAPKQETEAA